MLGTQSGLEDAMAQLHLHLGAAVQVGPTVALTVLMRPLKMKSLRKVLAMWRKVDAMHCTPHVETGVVVLLAEAGGDGGDTAGAYSDSSSGSGGSDGGND